MGFQKVRHRLLNISFRQGIINVDYTVVQIDITECTVQCTLYCIVFILQMSCKTLYLGYISRGGGGEGRG